MLRSEVLAHVAYLVAAVLFVLSLRGLSAQTSARQGNVFGMIGMGIAVVATLLLPSVTVSPWLLLAVVAGAGIGWGLAARVAMTEMPELTALLHSFVGMAAVLIGASLAVGDPTHLHAETRVEVYVDVLVGALTFTGSVMAFLKLRGTVSGRPLLLPGRHALNATAALAAIALGVAYALGGPVGLLAAGAAIAALLGLHLVAGIGGADMPVVVSLLNSYSGWTAAAAGFMLKNDLLIVTGALVGSSGAILSTIMCRAMNRSIWNVVFGGFGAEAPKSAGGSEAPVGDVQEIVTDDLAARLHEAKEVVIVPGYGMAVARAQHAVRELTDHLRQRGTRVRFAIHPVAGRLPGHMNVLLAEASVPYDIVFEMEEIDHELDRTDVVIVIGANDIVNPAAEDDPSSPLYGMPVLRVWTSKLVVVNKRGRATGYAGVDNPLFYRPVTRMLFGDAKSAMEGLVQALKTR